MTQGKEEKPGNGSGSRLKGALGLDNLKGLGDTLKQIKEVKESIDEAQKTIGDLAQGNSPVGRALASLIEAHGIKELTSDNFNLLQEVREKMAKELEQKDEEIERVNEENRGLKERERVSDTQAAVEAALDRRFGSPGSQNGGGGESKLTKALEDVVADHLKRIVGGGETLTADAIRAIIREEVPKVAGGTKTVDEVADDIVAQATLGDKVRERLGGGLGGRLLPGSDGGGSLRTDLIKIILEDEREKLKIEHEHEAKTERNKQIGIFVGAVKENVGDIAAGFRVAAEEVQRTQGAKPEPEQPPQQFKCGDCETQFGAPGWAGQNLKCPKCGREYTQEELLGD